MLPFHAAAREADTAGNVYTIGCGGARGPGKSFGIMSQIGLDDCQRIPGLKYLFLRLLQKSATESMEDLAYKALRGTQYTFTKSPAKITFPNGSTVLVGGFHNENDIDKYLGIEYDGLGIEELTQLGEEKVKKLYGSVRSTKPGWRARVYWSSNPGGIGHAWVKKAFIDPFRRGVDGSFLGSPTRFFQGNYKDNPLLSAEYIAYLEALGGSLGEMWRDGNWDVFEGMAFPGWDYNRHTCDAFEIPYYWPKWRAVDWGYHAPFCCLWLTKDPDIGRVYVYREVYGKGLTDKQQAEMILSQTPPDESISITYADPSMWTSKTQEDLVFSTADEYRKAGVILTKADNNRIGGKRKVVGLLSDIGDGMPGIQVFRESCPNLIRTLPNLPTDKYKPEDVDTDAEDHAYDALKYGLTNEKRTRISKRKSVGRPGLQILQESGMI